MGTPGTSGRFLILGISVVLDALRRRRTTSAPPARAMSCAVIVFWLLVVRQCDPMLLDGE